MFRFQTVEEEGKKVPYFVIVVHLPGIAQPNVPVSQSGKSNNTQGWVVSRKLEEFQALHKQLKQVCVFWFWSLEVIEIVVFFYICVIVSL